MLLRAAGASRGCLTCRLGLQLRRATPYLASPIRHPALAQQRYASDSRVQSKQRVEALILGKAYDEPKAKRKPTKRGSRRSKADKASEAADSKSRVQSKERIEALILGNPYKEPSDKKEPRSPGGSPRGSQGLRPSQAASANATAQSKGLVDAPDVEKLFDLPSEKQHRGSRKPRVTRGSRQSTASGTVDDLPQWSTAFESNARKTNRHSAKDFAVDDHVPTNNSNLAAGHRPDVKDVLASQLAPEDHGAALDDIEMDDEVLQTDTPAATTSFSWELQSSTAQKWARNAEEASAAPRTFPTAPVSAIQSGQVDEGSAVEADQDELPPQEPVDDPVVTPPETDWTSLQDNLPFQHVLLRKKPLRIDALGNPIEALILKNPNRMREPKKPIRALRESADIPEIDWDMLLKKEDDATDSETSLKAALDNINELRPKESSVVWKHQYERLTKILLDGFTRNQLAHYLTQNRRRENRETKRWLVNRSDWQSPSLDARDVLKPKQQQVLLILEEVWGLQLRENQGKVGQTSIWLRPEVFHIISRPSNPIIKRLKDDLLDESAGEGVVPSPGQFKLDIHSRQRIAPVFLAQLDRALGTITSRAVMVKHVKSENLSADALEDLGRITNTYIQYNKAASQVKVSWLAAIDNQATPAAEHAGEDQADIVSRLLMAGSAQELQSSNYGVLIPQGTSRVGEGVFLPHHGEKRSMSWRDKLYSWARYVFPVQKGDKTSDQPIRLASNVELPQPPPEEVQTENRVAATFGHILHAQREHEHEGVRKGNMRLFQAPLEMDGSRQSRRILAPLIPHPAALTFLVSEEDGHVTQDKAIIITFTPNPTNEAGISRNAPQVRLRLPVDSDTDLANFVVPSESTLYGIVPWDVNDILLPSESVDVRIVQQRILPLDINQPSLRKFLAASDFNLLAGRLHTPSAATLSIPERWVSPHATASGGSLDVQYKFTGLEIHQTAEMKWQGHTLRYNSIEAGQHGGQRQELSLQASEANDSTEDAKPSFLQLVEEVAQGKHFLWGRGHVHMKARSQPDFAIELEEEYDTEGLGLEEVEQMIEDDLVPVELRPSEEDSVAEELLEHGDSLTGHSSMPFELRPSEDDTILEAPEELLKVASEPSPPDVGQSQTPLVDTTAVPEALDGDNSAGQAWEQRDATSVNTSKGESPADESIDLEGHASTTKEPRQTDAGQ